MDMIYQVKTELSFDDAVVSLKEACASVGFGTLWQLNFKDKLHEKGLEFDDNFMVLEVCNPGKAQKVLLEYREAGFFLPCKVAVYEKGGEVFMGMPRPTELMAMLGSESLKSVAKEVEDTLVAAIEKAV